MPKRASTLHQQAVYRFVRTLSTMLIYNGYNGFDWVWVSFGQCVVRSCYRLLLSHLLPIMRGSCTLGPGRASNDGRTCYVCRPLITATSRNRISAPLPALQRISPLHLLSLTSLVFRVTQGRRLLRWRTPHSRCCCTPLAMIISPGDSSSYCVPDVYLAAAAVELAKPSPQRGTPPVGTLPAHK